MQRKITKDLLTYLPGKALPALAAFITVPIYTRMFSPNEFGNYALAVAASEFLLLGTSTGFGQGAVRFFSAYQMKSNLSGYFATVFGSISLITFAAAAISAGLLLICQSFISPVLLNLFWAALALYTASTFNAIFMDVLRGQEKSRWYSIVWVCQCYGGIAIGLILVLIFGMDISGLIWGQTLGLVFSLPPLIWLTTRGVPLSSARIDRADFKQLWAFALPFTIGNLAFWTLSLADRYIVEMFRGSYEVGLYSVASKISWRSIQLLVNLFFLVPAPVISRLWEEKGRQATEDALTSFTRIFFLMVIPSVVGLAAVAAPLLRLLADESYFGGYPAIWLAAITSMALGLSDLGSSGCLVMNRTRLIARNQCIAAGTGLILNFILVPILGFMGAALSGALAFFLLAGLQAITSARYLTWRWPLTSLWHVLVASAAMAAVVLLVEAGLPADTTTWQIINLLISIVVGALIYGLGLWILGEISSAHLMEFFRADTRQPTSETERS